MTSVSDVLKWSVSDLHTLASQLNRLASAVGGYTNTVESVSSASWQSPASITAENQARTVDSQLLAFVRQLQGLGSSIGSAADTISTSQQSLKGAAAAVASGNANLTLSNSGDLTGVVAPPTDPAASAKYVQTVTDAAAASKKAKGALQDAQQADAQIKAALVTAFGGTVHTSMFSNIASAALQTEVGKILAGATNHTVRFVVGGAKGDGVAAKAMWASSGGNSVALAELANDDGIEFFHDPSQWYKNVTATKDAYEALGKYAWNHKIKFGEQVLDLDDLEHNQEKWLGNWGGIVVGGLATDGALDAAGKWVWLSKSAPATMLRSRVMGTYRMNRLYGDVFPGEVTVTLMVGALKEENRLTKLLVWARNNPGEAALAGVDANSVEAELAQQGFDVDAILARNAGNFTSAEEKSSSGAYLHHPVVIAVLAIGGKIIGLAKPNATQIQQQEQQDAESKKK